MFDSAVIGAINIGMRHGEMGGDSARGRRNGPQLRPIRRWIAGRMRVTADWIDPALPLTSRVAVHYRMPAFVRIARS